MIMTLVLRDRLAGISGASQGEGKGDSDLHDPSSSPGRTVMTRNMPACMWYIMWQ